MTSYFKVVRFVHPFVRPLSILNSLFHFRHLCLPHAQSLENGQYSLHRSTIRRHACSKQRWLIRALSALPCQSCWWKEVLHVLVIDINFYVPLRIPPEQLTELLRCYLQARTLYWLSRSYILDNEMYLLEVAALCERSQVELVQQRRGGAITLASRSQCSPFILRPLVVYIQAQGAPPRSQGSGLHI